MLSIKIVLFTVLVAALAFGQASPTREEPHLTPQQRRRWWKSQAASLVTTFSGAATELATAAAQVASAIASGADTVHSLIYDKTTMYSDAVASTLAGGLPADGTAMQKEALNNPNDDGFGVLAERFASFRPDALLRVSGAVERATYQKKVDALADRLSSTLKTPGQGQQPLQYPLATKEFDSHATKQKRIASVQRNEARAMQSLETRSEASDVGSRLAPPTVPASPAATSIPPNILLVYSDSSPMPEATPKTYTPGILSGRRLAKQLPSPASRMFNVQATSVSLEDYVSISTRGTFCVAGAVAVPNSLIDDGSTFLCTYQANGTVTGLLSAREFLSNSSVLANNDTARRSCLVKYANVVCACGADSTLFYDQDLGKRNSLCVASSLTCSTQILFPQTSCRPRDPNWQYTVAPLVVSDGCLAGSRTATNYTFEYRLSCTYPLATNQSSEGYYIPGDRELLAVSRGDVSTAPKVDPQVDLLTVILNATEGASFSSDKPTYASSSYVHDTNLTYNALRRSPTSLPYVYQAANSSSTSDNVNGPIAASLSFTALNPLLYGTKYSQRSRGTAAHITRVFFADGFYNFNVPSDRSQQFRIYLDDVAAMASGVSFAQGGTAFWDALEAVLSGAQTMTHQFSLRNMTDDFFAGGRLYGEMGIDGIFGAGDRAIVVIDVTDAPRGNYQKPKRVVSVALIAGLCIIIAILFAGAVYLFKQWRNHMERERNRKEAHLLLSNDYH